MISLWFIFIVYNIIQFDEEFLIMITILISFSQILNLLFTSIRKNYLNFFILLKNIYVYYITFFIRLILQIIKTYKRQRKLRRRTLSYYYKFKFKLKKMTIFFNLNLNYLIQLLSLNFLEQYIQTSLQENNILVKKIYKKLKIQYIN